MKVLAVIFAVLVAVFIALFVQDYLVRQKCWHTGNGTVDSPNTVMACMKSSWLQSVAGTQ
jgi:hypothetical protein